MDPALINHAQYTGNSIYDSVFSLKVNDINSMTREEHFFASLVA